MDHKDKNFFIALSYTAATEKELDLLAFRQKVEENQKALSEYDAKHPGKVKI